MKASKNSFSQLIKGREIMKIFLILTFNYFVIFASKFDRNVTKSVNKDLVNAIQIVLDTKFFPSIPMINVVFPVKNHKKLYFQDLQTAFLQRDEKFFNGTYLFRLDDFTQITKITHRWKVNNLILLDNYESFLVLEQNLTPTKFNFRGFYFFVFVEGLIDEIQIIADALFKRMLYNAYLIYESEGVVKISEFQLLRGNQCKAINATHIDTFSDGKFMNRTNFFSLGKF
jgi:hypothetical protein